METVLLDGWLLRFASGYTRRANCVHPLYPSRENLDEKIPYCEALFEAKNIVCRFKLTDASDLTELDRRLDARGYAIDAPALLMYRPGVSTVSHDQEEIYATVSPNPEWLRFFVSMKNLSARDARTLRQILGRILPEKRFFWKAEDDSVIGCVLAVYERGFTGIFDLFVDEAHRGKQHGLSLLRRALSEGIQHNCPQAYLQVDETNDRAIRLYREMGFEVAYRYWYRLKGD